MLYSTGPRCNFKLNFLVRFKALSNIFKLSKEPSFSLRHAKASLRYNRLGSKCVIGANYDEEISLCIKKTLSYKVTLGTITLSVVFIWTLWYLLWLGCSTNRPQSLSLAPEVSALNIYVTLSSITKCDPKHSYHCYDFGHTLLCCLSMTQMFNKLASEAGLLNKSLCLARALGVTKFMPINVIFWSHFVMQLKYNLDVLQTGFWGRFVKQKLVLCQSSRCYQIHCCHWYDFGHTLLSYLSPTWMFNQLASDAEANLLNIWVRLK